MAARWVAAFILAGCGSSESTASHTPLSEAADGGDGGSTFEFVNNCGQPGAAEGLQSLFNLHKQRHPEVRIFNTTLDFNAWTAVPKDRLAAGNPPDLIMWQANEMSAIEPLLPLDASLAELNVREVVYPELLEQVTVSSQIHALPWDVIRGNTLVYNKHVFRAHDLNPPTTLDEFLTVCRKLKAEGVTAVGGFGLGLLLADLIAGVLGPEAHCNFIKTGTPDVAALRAAIDIFAELFDNHYYDLGTVIYAGNPMSAESDALMKGSIAMAFTGDWMMGTLEQMGWTSGVDFGLLAPPDTAELFVFNLFVLGIPENARHPQQAIDFLQTAGSLEGQTAFYRTNRGTSARKDMPLDVFDEERRAFVRQMYSATQRCPMKLNWYNWEVPLVPLAQATPVDKEAVLQVVLSYP